MQAIILAGGKGTRLKPYTMHLPKPLVPIGDYPILEIVLRQLSQQGFSRVTICTGHLAELIQAYFGNGKRWGLDVNYVREETPLNTAGALSLVEDLEDTFIVLNGDILTTLDYRGLMDVHANKQVAATIAVKSRKMQVDFGVLHINANGLLEEYEEKPELSYRVSMGAYVLSRRCVDLIRKGESMGMPDLLTKINKLGMGVFCHEEDCLWLDIGRVEDYESAQQEFFMNRKRYLNTDE